MAKESKKLKQKKKPLALNVIDNVLDTVHEKKLLLFGILTGVTFFLIFALVGYIEHKPLLMFRNVFNIPKAFTISTILLLTINSFISKIVLVFEVENFKKAKKYALIGLVLLLAFTVSQAIGCYHLFKQQIHFVSPYSTNYIYMIYGVYILGLVVGATTLIHYFLLSAKLIKNHVKRLIVTTNPYQKVKLEMLSIFWNYFTYSWVLIYLYYYFTIV